MGGWLAVPRDWIANFGEIAKFCGRVLGQVYGLRVFRFFGEALRQAGILILSSTLVIWGLVFIIGLQCGIEGAYFNRSVGAPAYAGVFSAWCDLRELVPYAFGYMMAAKVGTGIVAELGSMRISDEIDALEVMGIDSMLFLCATRLLAAWMVLPFMYIAAVGAGFFASYLAVVQQIGEVSSGGFFLVFWMFQNPPDLLYSVIKGMFMATAIVLVGLLLRLQRERRPGRGRDGDGEVDGAEHRARAPHRDARHAAVLGREPASPDRRLRCHATTSATDAPTSTPRSRSARRTCAATRTQRRARRAQAEPRVGGQRAGRALRRRRVPLAHGPEPPDRRRRRRRVRRRPQGVRPQQDPARPEHGHPRGQDLDDPRARRARASRCASSTWSACCTPTRATSSSTASPCRTCTTTSCSRCARSSASSSRTARCSAR